jgi:hypothetical protein
MFGMLQEFIAQFKTPYFNKTRIVFNLFGNGHLPARKASFNQNCIKRGAHGINTSGQARRPSAQND